jgi:RNA polymerase sigma-70 factor (ECF subfamily)
LEKSLQQSEKDRAQLLWERRAIERAQGGDLAALEPVLAHHAEALFAAIFGRLGDRAQAEDILKDTFVTAMERIGSFSWQDRSIYLWLRQVALNKVIDHHRAAGRRRRLCQALKAEVAQGEEAGTEGAGPLHALTVEEERRRAEQRIAETLKELNPRYAAAIRLRLCEERPRAECAQALGVTVETFDVLLYRAVRAFRKVYGEPDVP